MNENKVITKCCICGREKTDRGWQFTLSANESERVYSHGFCTTCYDIELMKARMRIAMPALAVLH